MQLTYSELDNLANDVEGYKLKVKEWGKEDENKFNKSLKDIFKATVDGIVLYSSKLNEQLTNIESFNREIRNTLIEVECLGMSYPVNNILSEFKEDEVVSESYKQNVITDEFLNEILNRNYVDFDRNFVYEDICSNSCGTVIDTILFPRNLFGISRIPNPLSSTIESDRRAIRIESSEVYSTEIITHVESEIKKEEPQIKQLELKIANIVPDLNSSKSIFDDSSDDESTDVDKIMRESLDMNIITKESKTSDKITKESKTSDIITKESKTSDKIIKESKTSDKIIKESKTSDKIIKESKVDNEIINISTSKSTQSSLKEIGKCQKVEDYTKSSIESKPFKEVKYEDVKINNQSKFKTFESIFDSNSDEDIFANYIPSKSLPKSTVNTENKNDISKLPTKTTTILDDFSEQNKRLSIQKDSLCDFLFQSDTEDDIIDSILHSHKDKIELNKIIKPNEINIINEDKNNRIDIIKSIFNSDDDEEFMAILNRDEKEKVNLEQSKSNNLIFDDTNKIEKDQQIESIKKSQQIQKDLQQDQKVNKSHDISTFDSNIQPLTPLPVNKITDAKITTTGLIIDSETHTKELFASYDESSASEISSKLTNDLPQSKPKIIENINQEKTIIFPSSSSNDESKIFIMKKFLTSPN